MVSAVTSLRIEGTQRGGARTIFADLTKSLVNTEPDFGTYSVSKYRRLILNEITFASMSSRGEMGWWCPPYI